MSPWRDRRGFIGLAGKGLAWQAAGQGHSYRLTSSDGGLLAGWPDTGLEAALADVFQSAGKQQSWTLVLAPDTAPPFVLECPQGIRSVTELAQLARVRAARLFGGVPLDWEIAADWQLKSPTLCAAAPAQVLSAVQTTAHGAKRRVVVVAATSLCYSRLWSCVRLSSGDLAWPMPGYLMLANARGGQLQSFRCIRKHPFQTPHSWAADAWREAARESALAGSQLEQLTLAWPGQVPPEGMESGLEQTEKFRWIDARNFLPAWHDSAEGAAEWMVRLALGGAA